MSDGDIRKYLSRPIKIVREENGNYFPLSGEAMKKILTKPRNTSLTFDAEEIDKKNKTTGLEEYKNIIYLVKSSSRFFLKPDIGEIFDQIEFDDLYSDKIKAICVRLDYEYETLEDTEGEHFLMTATLMTEKTWIEEPFLNKT